jgi:CDP-glucose 4,6-dehydratase
MELWKSPLENMVRTNELFWKGRSVFVTGHTGFKGSWLVLWLRKHGAEVHGYALDPPTEPNLFTVAGVAEAMATDTRGDLADSEKLKASLFAAKPEIVFHLAAQPLVRESYVDPTGTFMTNVMGTVHLLDAVCASPDVRSVVCVTTDKVYQNKEWVHPYREEDALGGYDPYSASKAACEVVIASYRSSFFHYSSQHPALVATARAGNVIGGGDWATNRLVPDCLKAFTIGESVHLRFPGAVRPWQHVLEPLAGYMRLAEALSGDVGRDIATAWNFGPDSRGDATVGTVADILREQWGNDAKVTHDTEGTHPHEAGLLSLDSSRARRILGWQPRWNLEDSLSHAVDWHKKWIAGADMKSICLQQIETYESSI